MMSNTALTRVAKIESKGKRKGIFKKRVIRYIIYFILLIHLVLTGYPFVWMVISGFKSDSEYFGNPWGLPTEWRFDNFINAWNQGISNYFFNSMYITFFSVVGLLIVATFIAFYLSIRPFKGSKLILGMFFLAMLIPVHSTLIPLFELANLTGLYDTFWSLFFPYIGFNLPIAIFLAYGFFSQIPKDIEEAAVIDGCNIYQLFFNQCSTWYYNSTYYCAIFITTKVYN